MTMILTSASGPGYAMSVHVEFPRRLGWQFFVWELKKGEELADGQYRCTYNNDAMNVIAIERHNKTCPSFPQRSPWKDYRLEELDLLEGACSRITNPQNRPHHCDQIETYRNQKP